MAREKGMGNLQREKSGRWTARVCVDGERWSRSTRTTDKVQAERFLQRMLAPLGLGERKLALADVWREYEKSPNRRDLAASTLNAKRIVWMHFAEWIELNHPEVAQLKQLCQEHVAEYLRVLRINHTASTYNNRLCVICEICRTLSDKAGLDEDPWKGIRLLADDSHTRRELTVNELRRVVSASIREKGEWKTLFLVGIYTGLRLGDCCCLQWREVNLDRGIIQVLPRKVRKHLHGRPVTIPIHSELDRRLRELQDKRGQGEQTYVMPKMSEWYLGDERWRVSDGLARIFRSARIKTSIRIEGRKTVAPDATFHSLRHTFVSLSANAGVPLPVVQSIVGHSSTAMTRHYYHENESELRRAVAAIPSLGEMANEAYSSGCGFGQKIGKCATIAERLRALDSLLASGMIKKREYSCQRARILADL